MITNIKEVIPGSIFIIILGLIHIQIYAQTNFPVVDTGQEQAYNNTTTICLPSYGGSFFGQDANYDGNQPSYTDNGDGTVTDNITGLMWVKTPDMDKDGNIDYEDKMSYTEALAAADTFSLAGYTDWRLPSIKEMYSLKMFYGVDPSGYNGTSTVGLIPFINTDYFDFGYGDQSAGERIIDSQLASSTLYVGTTMNGAETMFGVNFADGRIKGYPTGAMPGQTVAKQFYVMFVRGSTYGENDFHDNNDSTITDSASGLMWTKYDDGAGMNWEDALAYAENAGIAGYTDWRLPNVKELQSIVDYTRSLQTSNSAAIDPVFECSEIMDEGGSTNYPFYWTGTTHENMSVNNSGTWACYVCFGEALGFMEDQNGNFELMDVHGAGAQRSDPKTGNPSDYPNGHGPQGDVVRVYNFVRLVRDAGTSNTVIEQEETECKLYPNPVKDALIIEQEAGEYSLLNIYNICGQQVLTKETGTVAILELDVSELPKGMYLVQLEGSSSKLTKRFIKQ